MNFDITGGDGIRTVAQAIQLAVAPAFLLTGVGAMLGVTANRLSRIVDRARVLEQSLLAARGDDRERILRALGTLARRAHLIGRAITLCTVAALIVANVIIALFIGAVTPVPVATAIASLFIAAMLSLIVGLMFFLREVFVATGSLRIGSN